MDDQTKTAATDDGISIAIVVRRASEPIDGTITFSHEQPAHFTGWMQLTRLIARVVDPAP